MTRHITLRGKHYASVAEASRDLGVSRQQIYRWLDRDKVRRGRPVRRKLTQTERELIGVDR